MIGRAIGTVAVLAASFFVSSLWAPWAMQLSAQAAGGQFTDQPFAVAFYQLQGTIGISRIIFALTALALILIWYRPVKRGLKAAWAMQDNRPAAGSALALIVGLGVLVAAQPAFAFWDKTDRTEAYTVLPNQTAFWIPNAGDKEQQGMLDSEAFLAAKKIPARLFLIPHTKFSGSGGTSILSGWDYYVPTGRLILVDRAPYSREWVAGEHRGTSKSDESFPCQSQEGVNVGVGMSIGATVAIENAAKFLFNFGVKNPVIKSADGKELAPTDPEVIFTSVYYGRSLAEVMDDVVRKKIQTLMCSEVQARSFVKANTEAVTYLGKVTQEATAWAATKGITIDFLGYADTFKFDPAIQDAVNRTFVASQDQIIATALAQHVETLKGISVASAIRDWGGKADGHLPGTIVGLPPNLEGLISTLIGKPIAPAK